MVKEYNLDGKIVQQRRITLGQIRQLTDLCKKKGLDTTDLMQNLSPTYIVATLGEHLPSVFAIILKEKDVSLRDKDLESFEKEIEFLIDPEIGLDMVQDFFELIPPSLVMNKFQAVFQLVLQQINEQIEEDGEDGNSLETEA